LVGNIQKLFDTQGKEKAHEQNPLPINIGNINIRAAWENRPMDTNLPVAIRPTHIHARMNVQRSYFTIQGQLRTSLSKLSR